MKKDQVWKNILVFHTNRPKIVFQSFPGWKMTTFFQTFPDSAGTLRSPLFFSNNCVISNAMGNE